MVFEILRASGCCSQGSWSNGREPLKKGDDDDDDDHNACNEFSSCGQLEQSTKSKRKVGSEMRKGKMDFRKKKGGGGGHKCSE